MVSLFLDDDYYPKDDSLARVEKISRLSGIDNIAVLPEVHYKKTYPAPTGVVFISKNTIMPQLIAMVINCGMRIIATPIKAKEVSDKIIDKIYSNLMHEIRITQPSNYVLDGNTVLDIMFKGSRWALERFGLEESELDFIENKGNMFHSESLSRDEVKYAVPEPATKVGRFGLQYMGGGGHFIELQKVREIYNKEIAGLLNLEEGGLIFMLHSDSGLVGGMVNQFFSYNRLKEAPLTSRLKLGIRKWQYHLSDPASFFSIAHIYDKVFKKADVVGFDADSTLGRRYKIASYAACNFGYVKRMALTESLRKSVRNAFGDPGMRLPLIYDVSHNLIQQQEFESEKYWVHRHGCCAALPPSKMSAHPIFSGTGQPFPLPGSMATPSYVCVGAEGSKASFYSSCHGSGNVTGPIEGDVTAEAIMKELNRKNVRLYKHGKVNLVKHSPRKFKDAGIVAKTLENFNIAKIVAKVEPMAVIKE